MPAAQLHLTFAEALARDPQLADELRQACAAEPRYTRLGAIFHDLPYYGNMAIMAIRYGLRRPAEESYWGQKVHYDRPDEYLAHFVATARTLDVPLTRRERLALVAGFSSHAALDLSLHPLVNHIARRDRARFGGAESHHHRLAEKYHAMFYHLDMLGRDVIGSTEMHEKTRVTKLSSLVWLSAERPLVAFARATYHRMWNEAPAETEWCSWVRSFAHFGVMVGSRVARRNSLRLRTDENRRRYFQSTDFDFYAFWEAGRRRGLEIANRAYRFFQEGDASPAARAQFIADVAFDGSLGEPLGLRGPALPAPLAAAAPLNAIQ
jgi:hypothetical protein